jgi:uncharacterized zinc-type alcohol dehydrogenase-like protein
MAGGTGVAIGVLHPCVKEKLSMIKSVGYAANHSFSSLKPLAFEREEPKQNEIEIEVMYCGVCHSDIHQVKNEWHNTVYPCMPGHEVVGRVKSVGAAVTRHAVGDLVGVGCMIDSCRQCEPCQAGEQNYCEGPNSWLATYNGPMVPSAKAPSGTNQYGKDNTYGGYSTSLVVPEDFALKIPAGLKPEVAAPILCAGVTTYSPMKHWGVRPGKKVAILGFGGLGDIAQKIAKAMGAEVTVFTTSQAKVNQAPVVGTYAVHVDDHDMLESLKASFDFILSTIPKKTDLTPFVPLLKRDGTLVIVGALEPLAPFNNMQMAAHRNAIAGSLIGSIAETQEILDLCAQHGIGPDIELLDIKNINDAYTRVEDGEVRYRYVIDMATLKPDAVEAA